MREGNVVWVICDPDRIEGDDLDKVRTVAPLRMGKLTTDAGYCCR